MEKINTFIYPIIRQDNIERSLETLYKYTDDNFYVYVVDQTPNGVYDKIKDKIHMYFRPYRNLGFAKAVNTGIRLADTPFVTIINDDTEFINKKWWNGILETFHKYGDTVLGVNPMSPKQAGWGYGWAPDKYVELMPYKETYTEEDYNFLLKGDFTSIEDKLPKTFPRHQTGVIDAIAMWFVVFKREAFDKVGLFHERFYPGSGEDYDFNCKCYSKNYRLLGTTLSWVYHHWSGSKGKGMGEGNTEDVVATIDPARAWNKLGELWPAELNEGHDFDVWGYYTHEGVKKPLNRALVSDIVPL